MTTITKDASTITPDQVLGYETSRESRNVEHDILNAGTDVSLMDDEPRAGDLKMYFASRAAAWDAFTLHSTAGVFALVDGTLTQLNMSYVRKGAMKLALDDTMTSWVLTVGYREVI